jgi:outer membrane protein TolC
MASVVQAQQAEDTSTTIQKLRRQVEAGEASEVELERAEGVLANLTGSLNYLQSEMKVALRGARRAFRQGFGEDSDSEVRAAGSLAACCAIEAVLLRCCQPSSPLHEPDCAAF